MTETTLIKEPSAGEKKSIFIQPHEAVNFDFDLKAARIDILGSDLVFTFKDGGQLILSNIAATLFSEDAPSLMSGGKAISADEILSNIGMVQNVSGKDAALLTSMIVDKNSKDQNVYREQQGKVVEKIVYKASPPVLISPPPTLEKSDSSTSEGAKYEQQFKKTFDELLTARAKDIDQNTNVGKFTAPPSVPNPPKIEALIPQPPGGPGGNLVFSAKLLQLSPSVFLDTNTHTVTYKGGTGSGAATLDPSFLTQTQSQFIDLTKQNGLGIIYGNDPALISDHLLSRAMVIQAAIPKDYQIGAISIAGLPAGYTIKGATPDVNGTYNFDLNTLTPGTGPQKFIVQYDPTTLGAASDLDGDGLAHEYAQFDVVIHTSVFDPNSGNVVTDVHTIHTIVKDTSLTDFGYTVNNVDGWVLDVKPNANIILAGDGGATVYAGSQGDRISTGTGNDVIHGGAGNDNITTSSGNDSIDSGTGNNIIDGGDGEDLMTYATRNENISVDLGATPNAFGQVTVTVGASQTDLIKNIEDITTGGGTDTLLGDNNNNVLNGGGGNDFLMGRGGNDTLIGGGGNDTVSYTYATNGVTVDLQAGTAVVTSSDHDTIQTVENIIGSDYNDTLLGDANVNNIQGGLGDDLLNGRTGNDVIDGGAGNNTIAFSNQTSGVTLTLQNAGNSTATSVGGDTITLSNIQNITGSAYNDVLTGNNVDNIIRSGGGNDTLDGGTGAADVLSYDDQAAAVTADLGAGTVVKSGGSDTFSNFDIFTATSYNDTIIGGALISVINGGAGTDTLSYQNTGGAVTVNLVTQTTTGALTNTFTSIENVTGGGGNDTLTGDSGNNVMSGGNGNDTIFASGGVDTLNGDAGTDTANFTPLPGLIMAYLGTASLVVSDDPNNVVDPITGLRVGVNPQTGLEQNPGPYYNDYSTLTGIETIVGSNFNDVFVSGTTNRTLSLDGGAGTDWASFATETNAVTANLSSTATGSFGTYTFLNNSIENLVGGSGNDILTGTSGDNLIYGNAGNDTFNPNGGNDTLFGGLGTDTATFNSYAAAVTVDLAALTVTDASAGVTTLNSIETIVGTTHDDTFLSGLSIANFTLDGGVGTDTISFAPLQAAVTVNLTTNTATVGLGSSYTLSNFENIIGGGLSDSLTGSAGNNIISGGGGNDFFYGSLGTDILDGGSGTDYYAYGAPFGNPFTASLGAADILITDGATYNTTLRSIEWIGGTSGNDTFNSGAVARSLTLNGEGGTDTLSFATETTSVTASLGSIASGYQGSATGAFGNYSLWYEQIENLTGGSGNDTLTGTGFDTYSNGNNVIIGGGGNDIIRGLGGNDTIDGGLGTDTATFSEAVGNISVNLGAMTVSYTDPNNHGSSSTLTSIETIVTGSGNDYFTVGGVGQTLTLDAGTGTDTIDFSSQNVALTADMTSTATGNFGTYTFTNNSFENLLSGSGSDTITGTAVANIIFGGNGTDTINAGSGDDYVDDSNTTFASNNSNVINLAGGDDTVAVNVATNTLDGGTGTDTLRYDSFAFGNFTLGHDVSSNLTFTLNANSTAGTVTDGVHTDTFTSFEVFVGGGGNDLFVGGTGNDTFYGQNGNDIFRGGAGNDTFFGGNGIDTADYSTAAAGVTANLQTGITSNDGDGGTDTFNGIENLNGSSFNDTLTGDNSINVLNGGDGNDTLIGGGGNDTLNGGNGYDTISYTTETNAITFNLNTNSATSGSVGTDSYLNIEQINSGSGNDVINSTPANLFANTILFDMGFGNFDSIVLSAGSVGTDATTLADHFHNVEYLDFRNANTGGGNLVFSGDNVFAMTDSHHALRLDISNAFGLTLQGGSYTLSNGPTVAGVTTYTFSTGATPVSTLEVHVS